jgi:hypothetical protein
VQIPGYWLEVLEIEGNLISKVKILPVNDQSVSETAD